MSGRTFSSSGEAPSITESPIAVTGTLVSAVSSSFFSVSSVEDDDVADVDEVAAEVDAALSVSNALTVVEFEY